MPIGHAASGARDRWVTMQALTESKGPSGFPVESWDDLTSFWAAKQESGGRERLLAAQLTSSYDAILELPYSEQWDPELMDVPKKRRLVMHDREFDIVFAEQIGRKRGVRVMTLARTNV